MVHASGHPSVRTLAISAVLFSVGLLHYAPQYLVLGSSLATLVSTLLLEFGLLFIYASQIWPKLLSPLRKLPQAPNAGFWTGQFRRILKEDTGVPMREWVNNIPNDGLIRYTVLFNVERVMATSPEALRDVLVTKSYEFVKPDVARQALGRLLGFGVLLAEGDEHKFQRKNLMPAFHYRHVKDLIPTFWNKSAEMIRTSQAEEQAALTSSDGAVIVFTKWVSRCTLDIIGVAGMGFDFNSIADPKSELSETYNRVFSPSKQAQFVQLASFFMPPFILEALPIARNTEMADAAEIIRRVSRKVILEKKQKIEAAKGGDVGKDILSVALQSEAFSDDNLVDQTMTFLAAGHETTSSATSWALYALSLDQKIQDKLREEVRQLLPSIGDTEAVVTAEMMDQCHYLHAVCNEVLRLYAPVQMTRREASQDTTLLGTPIRKGTDIIICPAAINTSKAMWGEDADKFNPDRWLGKNSNSGGAISNFALLTFLHGPRSCIGQAFSKQEFACILASIVGHYQFELEPKDMKVVIQTGVTMRPKGGLKLRMKTVPGW